MKIQNCSLIPLHERRQYTVRAWQAMCLTLFHVYGLSRLDGTLQDICTKGE